MFESLLNLVKEHAGEAIVNNPAIPNEHNDDAIQTATGGIMDHLKSLGGSGELDKIMGMFSGGDMANNSVVSGISGNVAQSLMSKFGINADQAGGIVNSLIPVVMNNLVKKTNDPNDSSFDLKGIMGAVGGNAGGMDGILNSVKNLF
mgnify:FL=1|jgi:uncharacterized protein YjgD (DUF1641 family)